MIPDPVPQEFFNRADASAKLVSDGYAWDHNKCCWFSSDGKQRAEVLFNDFRDMYYIEREDATF